MGKIIIGCDPDSEKSGFSFYVDGRLERLDCLSLVGFYIEIDSLTNQGFNVELHIENVNGISSNAFSVKGKDPLAVKLKKAEHVGKCKQTQIEIERIAERFNVPIIHHKVSKCWKDANGKAQFEKVTGWTGRSNADTRSAAYMGFLGLDSKSSIQ